jgi:hypothetical protein
MQRALSERNRMIVANIKSLPVNEQIRFAADLLDQGESEVPKVVATLRYVLSQLEGSGG